MKDPLSESASALRYCEMWPEAHALTQKRDPRQLSVPCSHGTPPGKTSGTVFPLDSRLKSAVLT